MNDRLPRKLAAILYADIASYSRLTGDDEDATHRTLTEYLDVVARIIESRRGQVMHYAGDAVLAMFEAVVDALSCAVHIQRDLAAYNEKLPENRRLRFRIGVNLGDVIEDRGDIYGDGVNVAARLESLAEPAGICISDAVRSAVGTRLPLDFEFLGEQQVKNITEPVRAYRARLRAGASLPEIGERRRYRTPQWKLLVASIVAAVSMIGVLMWIVHWQRPLEPKSVEPTVSKAYDELTIAVLPFDNMSGDPEQEYFADGIMEDLTTDLSKISGLMVIARNSAMNYKGREIKVQQIGEELGVRYVLEGSVRRAGENVRINVQLIETITGHQLWAERFDRDIADIFSVQDEVIGKIVAALAVRMTDFEQQQIDRIPTEDLEAYDYYLRAEHDAGNGFPSFSSALEHYTKAIMLDPGFADAYAGYAWVAVEVLRGNFDNILSNPVARRQAYEAASRALAMNPSTARAYSVLSILQAVDGEYEEALQSGRRATALAPGNSDVQLNLAVVLSMAGEHREGKDAMETALRMDPTPSASALARVGFIRFNNRQYGKALEALERARALHSHDRSAPDVLLRYLAATYAHLNRIERARETITSSLEFNPAYSIEQVRIVDRHNFKRDEDLEHYLDGLRKAGMPMWPFGFQGRPEARVEATALDALVFGRTWKGRLNNNLPFVQEIGTDGTTIHRNPTSLMIGNATIEREQLCLQFEDVNLGRKTCGYVYRNEGSNPERSEPYIYVNGSALMYLSPANKE